MGKDKQPVIVEDLTPEQLQAKLTELMAENATAVEVIANHEENLEALANTNEELAAKVKELEANLEASEKSLDEALAKIDQLENRVKTGKVTVTHNGQEYEVLPPTIGTRGLVEGKTSIPSSELEKYPDLIADYVTIKSGFLKLKEA